MEIKQYVVRVLLGTTLMLCFSGCTLNNNTALPTTVGLQTEASEATTGEQTVWKGTVEASSATEDTNFSEPVQTEPVQTTAAPTQPLQTEPPQTEPTQPPQTEPAKTEPTPTEPDLTEPPQTESVQAEQIQAQPVIDRATAALAGKLPEVSYDPGWTGGTVVTVSMELGLSEDEMVRRLLIWMQDLFADALAGEESRDNVSYTYSLVYNGVAEDNSSHLFVLSYTSIGSTVEQIPFDSDAVVAQVTQSVLNSSRVTVTAFDGNGYTECVTIREVPHFYSTQDAVDCLISAVETEINTQSILGGPCSEFCLVYGSAEETCHVFFLYLR